MAAGLVRIPGGGRRRGPAARCDSGRMSGRRAGPAGLPPGTGSIHARLRAHCQVLRGRVAVRAERAGLDGQPGAERRSSPTAQRRAGGHRASCGPGRTAGTGADAAELPVRLQEGDHDDKTSQGWPVPGWEIPADDVADEDVNVLTVAGQRPPAGGAWLWVTTAEARRGGEFTALFVPRHCPHACGGDVLVRIAARERGTQAGPACGGSAGLGGRGGPAGIGERGREVRHGVPPPLSRSTGAGRGT